MRFIKKIKIVLLWLALLASDTSAQLMLKWGALAAKDQLFKVNRLIVSGYGMIFVSFLIWMMIIKETRLFVAVAATAFLYVTVAAASHIFMGEPISWHLAIGTIFIASGVFLLGLKEKKP